MRCRLMALSVGLLACGVSAAAETFTARYDQRVTQNGQMFVSRVMIKDDAFRIESDVMGMHSVSIRNATGLFTYVPAQGTAFRLPGLDVTQQAIEEPADYLAHLQSRGATKLRTEPVGGEPCDVYTYTDPQHGQVTTWVSQQARFPVRIELDGPGGQTLVELTRIELGVALAETLFQLPPDIKILDGGALLPGLGGEGTLDLQAILERGRPAR